MLLCEHVHADSASGKHTPPGAFDEVQVSRFPVDLGAFAVDLNLTNLRGRCEVDLLWLRGDTEDELARLDLIGGVEVADLLSRVERVLLDRVSSLEGHGCHLV